MTCSKLNDIKSLDDFEKFLNEDWSCAIKKWGGRVFIHDKNTYHLNQFVKHFEVLTSKPYDAEQVKRIAVRIHAINHLPLTYQNVFLKISTFVRQFFGNLFYCREKIINELIKGKITTAAKHDFRYLIFKRGTHQVACRVHGPSNKTFPRLSHDKDVTFATRSILRNKNLVVMRGSAPGTRMIGPCDFYGPLEKAHLYAYTIEIEDGYPNFFKIQKSALSPPCNNHLAIDFSGVSKKINVSWHKGNDPLIAEIKKRYETAQQIATGESLFPTSAGILEVEQQNVELPAFDATKYDLSSFKARLVKNDSPFSVAETEVSSTDSFCPVSYMFEELYAKHQVDEGGGLFLETHDFCQTMTPLDQAAKGVVVFGRWLGSDKTVLELIGVKIPYGYTLIVDKDSIHGDTTLQGMYMMAMTSNHKAMQTADVTFLKHKSTRKNFSLTVQNTNQPTEHNAPNAPGPIANFGQENTQFAKEVNNGWTIYNPFSRIANPISLDNA